MTQQLEVFTLGSYVDLILESSIQTYLYIPIIPDPRMQGQKDSLEFHLGQKVIFRLKEIPFFEGIVEE